MNYSKIISFAMSLVLVFTLLPMSASAAESSFSDVPSNHWAVDVIDEMVAAGVMNGVGDNQFAPDKPVTYAEFFTMIARQFYADKVSAGGEEWFSGYVTAVESVGITAGLQMSTPASNISRYDMAQVLYNTMKDRAFPTDVSDQSSTIADWEAVPSEYRDAVSVCYSQGMLTGVDTAGTFAGNDTMTRAQAAAVMSRLMKLEVEKSVPVISEIPAGATALTEDNILHLLGDGSKYEDGTFYLNNSGFEGTGGYIGFINSGYTTLTFTVTVHDKKHRVAVSDYGNVVVDGRLNEIIAAGSSKTYSVNIEGLKNAGIGIYSGYSCNAEVTNIYLS